MGKRIFKCENCPRIFKRKQDLNAHKCKKNAEETTKCIFCNDDKFNKNFPRHVNRCHKITFFKVFGVFLKFLLKSYILYKI